MKTINIKKHFLVSLFLISFCSINPVVSRCEDKPASKNVIAEIDGEEIMLSDVEKYLKLLPENERVKFQNITMKKMFIDDYITTELFFREGFEKKLSEDEQVRLRIESLERILVRDLYVNTFILPKLKVSDDEVFNYFKTHRKDYVNKGFAVAEHIVVLSKEEAEKIRGDIISGEISFADAVKKYSVDKQTSSKGGVLPMIINGGPVKGYRESERITRLAFSSKIGEISGPVKSIMGWHILRVKSRQDDRLQSFETVKVRIKEKLQKDKLVKLLDEEIERLKKSHGVTLYPQNIK